MAKKIGRRRSQAYWLLAINAVVWGAALIITKPALAITSPFRFLLYRYLVAGLISWPILIKLWPKIKKSLQILPRIILLELLGCGLALALLYLGLAKTSALAASFLASTTPVFTSLFGVWLLKEKIDRHESVGFGLAFLGTILLTMIGNFSSVQTSFSNQTLIGNLLIIAQNICIGFYYVLAKKYYVHVPKFLVSVISFWVGIFFFGALSLIEANGQMNQLLTTIITDWQQLPVISAALYMGIFGSIIGLTTYIKGQDLIEASEASLFTYAQPLIYIPLGIFWLKEAISGSQILALLLIAIGIYFANRKHR